MSEKINKNETIDIEALKEQLKKEIAAELKANSVNPVATSVDPYLEEYVEIQLFKDGKDYKDDVFVSCNGENCVIKRGIPVKVKRKFALILEQSSRQDVSAAEYSEERKREYSSQIALLNI